MSQAPVEGRGVAVPSAQKLGLDRLHERRLDAGLDVANDRGDERLDPASIVGVTS